LSGMVVGLTGTFMGDLWILLADAGFSVSLVVMAGLVPAISIRGAVPS
jgi:hypothetical protein